MEHISPNHRHQREKRTTCLTAVDFAFPLPVRDRELQRDVSAARTGSRGGRSTHGGRVGGAGKTAAAASADWASNSTSTFLELPQIETTAVSDKVETCFNAHMVVRHPVTTRKTASNRCRDIGMMSSRKCRRNRMQRQKLLNLSALLSRCRADSGVLGSAGRPCGRPGELRV